MVAFVGRHSELAALGAQLAAAAAGQPRLIQLDGPAGIGKTALLEHFLANTSIEPAPVVVWASGDETEQLLAYGVIEQLARSAGVHSPLMHVASAHLNEPVADPVTIGIGLLELLDRIGGQPVILAIDDAHWADRPSLQALIFALRRLVADQVLAILAVRDDESDLPDSLTRLLRRQSGTVLHLGGLDEHDLTDLATALGVGVIDPAAARRLRYGTQGNPLHARALLEEFPPTAWGSDDQLLPSPRSFRRVVRDRYDACAAPTRRLIDAAAVIGQHASLPTAVGLADVSDTVAALDEATRHDLLIAVQTDSPWTVSFPHPLVRAAVYDALGPARRQALHRAAAAVAPDAATALRHRIAAAPEPDEALATDLLRFADREAARHAWLSAAGTLISASRLSPDPGDAQRRALKAVVWTMLRGDAATAAGFAAEIQSTASGLLRHLVFGWLAMASDDPAAAEPLLAAAWTTTDVETDGELRGIIALTTAIHWYGRLDAQATVDWCRRALDLLPPTSPVYPLAETYLVHGLGYAGRAADSVAVAEAAADRPLNGDFRWVNPRGARGVLRLIEDDVDGARADLESTALTASTLGIVNTASFAFAYLARAEWTAGAWDEAVLHAERAVAINVESDFDFMALAVTGIAVLVPACRGDWATAENYLQSMSEHEVHYERSVVALGMSRARYGEAKGQPAAVLAALEPVLAFPRRDAIDEPGFWTWQDLYSDALVGLGRAAEADVFLRPHEELAGIRGRQLAVARLLRSRGRIEAALGHQQQAEAAFQEALSAIRHLHVPFERARIELAAGAFLRRLGKRRRAADLLGAAASTFNELRAVPYAERCAQELAAAGLTPHPVDRAGVGLTAQELVVARLAATGKSNRELADELVVSIKTIEYHLRNAFTKLGITSRRQLGERLAEL